MLLLVLRDLTLVHGHLGAWEIQGLLNLAPPTSRFLCSLRREVEHHGGITLEVRMKSGFPFFRFPLDQSIDCLRAAVELQELSTCSPPWALVDTLLDVHTNSRTQSATKHLEMRQVPMVLRPMLRSVLLEVTRKLSLGSFEFFADRGFIHTARTRIQGLHVLKWHVQLASNNNGACPT